MKRAPKLLLSGLLIAAVALSMASSRKVVKITELQHRIKISKGFTNYSAQDQQMIRGGQFRVGLDEYGLWLAKGEPAFYWHTWMKKKKKWCRVMLYGPSGGSLIDTAVYTCGARVVHSAKINPAIPCWRLNKVSPRLMAALPYFERRPLGRQWEIVTGLIRRGQTTRELALMLGKPYNTGVHAREDGTNAATQVFLDSTGEAYGLHVTLIKGLVVGWKIPAARALTPEAQARRLKATEQRLIAKMREIEARAVQRHREEMSLLSNIQANQTQMMESLVNRAETQMGGDDGAAGGGEGGGGGGAGAGGGSGGGGGRRVIPGRKTLTINGCKYSEPNGGQLGRPCSLDRPCPGNYSCHLVSSKSGMCVPKGQGCKR